MVADIRRNESRRHVFRQSSYINFKVVDGYFFCLHFYENGASYPNEAKLTVKPMYADDLWWTIWDAAENVKSPTSLRGIGAFAISGQIMTTYSTRGSDNIDDSAEFYKRVFDDADSEIKQFLKENPDADRFYPDEAKTDHDPDRLLYLMALIHNGQENEVVGIIKEAQRIKHKCMFHSGMFSDSYTYILRYCNRGSRFERIRKGINKIIKRFIKIQAFACMAISGNDRHRSMPSPYVVRFLSGTPLLLVLFLGFAFCENQSFPWAFLGAYTVILYFSMGDRFYKYCCKFSIFARGNKTALENRHMDDIRFFIHLHLCLTLYFNKIE